MAEKDFDSSSLVRKFSLYNGGEQSVFYCTGEPGTGFYLRDLFPDVSLAPIKYVENFSKLVKYDGWGENPDYKPPRLSKDGKKVETVADSSEAIGCWLPILAVVILSRIHPVLGFIPIPAAVLYWIKRIFGKNNSRYLKVKKEKRVFLKALPQNIDDYYIEESRRIAATLPSSWEKRILENMAYCLSEKAKSMIDVDDIYGYEKKDVYKDFCDRFESLFGKEAVFAQDFIEEENGVVGTLFVSDVALYVGVFDFLHSVYDIPVVDFGDFQLYLYPSFVIKAYDSLTFQVFENGKYDIVFDKLQYNPANVLRNGQAIDSLGKEVSDLGRIAFVLGDSRYTLILKDFEKARRFYFAWKYVVR